MVTNYTSDWVAQVVVVVAVDIATDTATDTAVDTVADTVTVDACLVIDLIHDFLPPIVYGTRQFDALEFHRSCNDR